MKIAKPTKEQKNNIVNQYKLKKQKAKIIKTEKSKDNITKILLTLTILIVAIAFLRTALGLQQEFSFRDFINFLVNLSNLQLNIPFFQYLNISGDWGIIDGIRIFLNTIMNIISVLLYIAELLINLITTIGFVIGQLIF